MTKEKKKNTSKQEIPDTPKDGGSESLFYIHDLREQSRNLFGVKPEVLDGVFVRTRDVQVTKSGARKRINEFLKKAIGEKKGVTK